MSSVRQAVILAGGRGSRLAPITDSLPKPMVDVNGEPFLAHLMRLVANQGITQVIVLTGYRGEQIHEHFGDGEILGIEIIYSHRPESWSTGERLLAAAPLLDSSFLLLYADNYVAFDLPALLAQPGAADAAMILSVCPKKQGNIIMGPNGSVDRYLRDRSSGPAEFVEVGFSLVSRDRFLAALKVAEASLPIAIDLMTQSGAVLAHVIHHPYFSVSDPERLERTRLALSRRRVLLLDRDGVINVKVGRGEYVSHYKDFRPIKSNWVALQMLAEHGFTFVVISNQAGVSRGLTNQRDLDEIHERMIEEMGKIGVDALDVYVCPHHWDDGCSCRKPSPGMFYTAAVDHSLLLSRLIYVGDDIRDEAAATAAGCTPVIIGPAAALVEAKSTAGFEDLKQAVSFVLDHYESQKDSNQ
jgi:histidinol-phosphate phosphatase family protein